MWWRIPRSQFDRQKGEENRRAMMALVEAGVVPGIIGYLDGRPAAWCSVAPRDEFPVLQRSRTLKPIDELPVWSIVCFFIAKPHRGYGLMVPLIRAAVDYAAHGGAVAIEGYPVEPRKDEMPPMLAFTGVPSAFQKAGFVEVERRSPTRPIMRLILQP